nr:MAG TPA: minor structural protein [Caudoviricetes sp.]
MVEFLRVNWQLITAFVGAVAFLYRQVIATRKGVRALLRADLIRLYNKYHDDLGYCPVYVKQSLEDEYQQYHALHGNGVGTQLYNALMNLPTEPQEGE